MKERCAKKIDMSFGQHSSMHLSKACSCFHESCMLQLGGSVGSGYSGALGALDPKFSQPN